jgi:hypothetical protein
MSDRLIARTGLDYPKDAAAAAAIAAAGGVSKLEPGHGLLKRVEAGEDCSDLPDGPMRAWLIETGAVEVVKAATKGAKHGR